MKEFTSPCKIVNVEEAGPVTGGGGAGAVDLTVVVKAWAVVQ